MAWKCGMTAGEWGIESGDWSSVRMTTMFGRATAARAGDGRGTEDMTGTIASATMRTAHDQDLRSTALLLGRC
jgi:hypothetical protein